MNSWWWVTGLGICNCERWFPQTCSCVSSQDGLPLQLETGGYVAVWSKLISHFVVKKGQRIEFVCVQHQELSPVRLTWKKGLQRSRVCAFSISRCGFVEDPWTSQTGANLSRILVLWLLFDIYVQGAWTWLWRQACWLVDQVHGGATQVRCSNMMR